MSTSSVVFVLLIFIQTCYGLTNKSERNPLSIEEDFISKFNRSSSNYDNFLIRDDHEGLRNLNKAESDLIPAINTDFILDKRQAVGAKFDSSALLKVNQNVMQDTTDSYGTMGSAISTSDMTDDTTTTNNEALSETTNIRTTGSFSTGITSNLDITSDDSIMNTTSVPPSKNNLPLILGLTLGLGIPASLVAIGGLVYYLKIYRPKQSQVAILTT